MSYVKFYSGQEENLDKKQQKMTQLYYTLVKADMWKTKRVSFLWIDEVKKCQKLIKLNQLSLVVNYKISYLPNIVKKIHGSI